MDDPDEDGPTEIWAFDPTVDNTAPGAGVAKFGPSDTFFAYSGIVPTISTDAGNNLLRRYLLSHCVPQLDGRPVEAEAGETILTVLERNGIPL